MRASPKCRKQRYDRMRAKLAQQRHWYNLGRRFEWAVWKKPVRKREYETYVCRCHDCVIERVWLEMGHGDAQAWIKAV